MVDTDVVEFEVLVEAVDDVESEVVEVAVSVEAIDDVVETKVVAVPQV